MDMDIPDTIPGIKEALYKHAMQNAEKFSAGEASLKALWKEVRDIQKHEQEEEKYCCSPEPSGASSSQHELNASNWQC